MDFNYDINFIVGINGTGKTTALRLIHAALTVNVRELLLITFREMRILFEKDARMNMLTITKKQEAIEFRINTSDDVAIIRSYEKDEVEQYSKMGKMDEIAAEARFRFLREKNTVSEFMSSIPEPIFIGLERRLKTQDMEYDDDFRASMPRMGRHVPSQSRHSIGLEGIDNARQLIKNEYRKYRRHSDSSNESLLNVIVRSTFQYMELDDTVAPQNKDQRYRDYQNIIARRKEIEQVARALGGSNHTQTQIDRFFEKLSNAYVSTDEEQEISLVEWLLNKAQIQRIDAILREMDRNKKNAAAIFAPIAAFIGAANFFFNDSKKHVSIDSLGELLVQRGGETIPLASLSSGERQMLTLLAHVVFMPKRNAGIVIIDEPELSLHLRWQEHLVAQLTELNSKLQFIFATHSPEIVGMRKDKTLRVVR